MADRQERQFGPHQFDGMTAADLRALAAAAEERAAELDVPEFLECTNLETHQSHQHPYGHELKRVCPFMITRDGPDQSSMMDKLELPTVRDADGRSQTEVLAEAEKMLIAMELPSDVRGQRLKEIALQVKYRGTYTHTFEELELGARLAWRLAPRCINRIAADTLQVGVGGGGERS